MKPKLCLVTGANSGIGRGLSLLLAEAGHRVIVSARSEEKANETRAAIVQKTGNQTVETLVMDLADMDSVRIAASEFGSRHGHLDVLCNIAGATFWKREESKTGMEMNFAVNHLGPFLLTNLLMDALKAAPQGRIVNVVGEFHRKAKLDLDDLQWKTRKYSIMKSGAASMLMRVMMTHELSRRLAGTTVTANCFHPGAVRSNLLSHFPLPLRILLSLAKPFMLSQRQGADTGFWLAVSEEARKYNGDYFIKRRPVKPSKESCDAAKAAQLWEISQQMLEPHP
jgi:NAD(P)-dependent dehydrogenase (short-subunit alcohol dehydrogenase family)